MDGGFEGQTAGTLLSTSSSSVPSTSWAKGGTSGSGTSTISSGGRTGSKYLTAINNYTTNTTGPKTHISPYTSNAAILPSTSYIIQFYAKATDNLTFPSTTVSAGISSASGTAAVYAAVSLSTAANYTKYTVAVTSPSIASSNGFSTLKIASATTNNSKSLDVDDWVVYEGNTADINAPSDPGSASTNNATGNTMEISWGAATDVDGGGYIVVRYSSNPIGQPSPNVNGIYSIGNTIGTGTIAYTGSSTSFTDAGLSYNTTYYYKIYTADKAFNYSNNSSTTSGTTNSTPGFISYYIDALGGNDVNSGNSTTTAWKNISKLNGMTIVPGTHIYLKAANTWTGQQLKFNGSGTNSNPIVVDAYGTGNKPLLAGAGVTGEAVVYLYNQSYIEINNLEITNSPNGAINGDFFVGLYQNGTNPLGADRRGIMVAIDNYGTANHIYLKNIDIHHIKGQLGGGSTVVNGAIPKRTGGIFFDVIGSTETSSSKSRFNDVLIDGCNIYYCENIGIAFDNEWNVYYPGGQNSSIAADVTEYNNWNDRRFSNVKISNNIIHHIGKNAMIVRCTDETGLIEYNVCYETALGTTGNTMFTARAKGTVFQYNEGYYNRATTQNIDPGNIDGSMYDPDFGSVGIIFQYSYSHDNSQGLYWGCNTRSATNNTTGIPDPGDVGCIARYNISQNDQGDLVFLNYSSAGNEIYNNVFYIKSGISPSIIHENSGNNHTYRYYNNIIFNLSGSSDYKFGSGTGTQTRYISNNLFYGNHPSAEPVDANKLTSNPLFVNPGSGTTGINSLNGYKLQIGSSAIGNGSLISNNGSKDYFGNNVSSSIAPNRGAYEGLGLTSLPIHLGGFTINKVKKEVQLAWFTLSEQNSSHFSIERAADGIHFEHISIVVASGNTNTRKNYAFSDQQPLNGQNFYRIVETDINGTTSISPIRSLFFEMQNHFQVYPNPATNIVYVKSTFAQNETISISIVGMDGKKIQTIQAKADKNVPIAVSNLQPGLYMLHILSVQTGAMIEMIPFMKH